MSGSRRSRPVSLHSSKSLLHSDDEEEVQKPENRAGDEGAIGENIVQENIGEEAGDENVAQSQGNIHVEHDQSAAGSEMSARQILQTRVPESEYLRLLENNCVLTFDHSIYKEEHRIIIELLKHHPYKKWFAKKRRVPVQYIQQWWKHLKIVGDNFESRIETVTVGIDVGFIREMLMLPEKDDIEGKLDFDETPESAVIIKDILKLGYNDELRTLSDFRRNKLPPIWAFLFNTINKCLSGKNSSLDQGSKQILQIFHGFVKNKHYDYATILWEDMKATIEKNQGFIERRKWDKVLKYIPYQRYWQLIIWYVMLKMTDIPRRADEEQGPVFYMGRMISSFQLTNFPRHTLLTRALRNYIPRDSEILREYLSSVGFVQPQIPAQEDQPERSGEGSIQEKEGENVQGGEHSERQERKNYESLVSKGKEKQNESGENEGMFPEIETERDVSELAVRIRAPTSATGSQFLVTGIEKDTTEPMVHIDKPQPSHSAAFKEADVLFQTGEPSQTRLEGGDKSQPTFVEHFESGLHSPIHVEPNIPFYTSTSQQFRTPVKTFIETPFVGPRGLDGSPGGVNITKAPLQSTFVVHGASVASTGQEFSELLKTGPFVGSGSQLEQSEFEKIQKLNEKLGEKVEQLESKVVSLTDEIKDLKLKLEGKMMSVEQKVEGMNGSLKSQKKEIKDILNEFQKDMVKEMNELKSSLIQALSVNLASMSQPLTLMPVTVIEPEAEATQSKRKFDDNELHNHQKGEKRLKMSSDNDIGIEDFEIVDMQLVQNVEVKILQIDESDEVGSGETEIMMLDEDEIMSEQRDKVEENIVISEKMLVSGEVDISEQVIVSEKVMSTEEMVGCSKVNLCRDMVLYDRREITDSEIEERRMNERLIRRMHSELVRVLNVKKIQRTVKMVKPIDLMGEEDSTVDYTQSFQDNLHFNFDDEVVNKAEFDRLEEFVMPSNYVFRKPIQIPKMNLPILEEPICDFILEISDVPLARQHHGDIFPEETYKDIYYTEGEYVVLESFVDGFLEERFQKVYSEVSNRLRVPDVRLHIQKRIEKVSMFQIEEFDGLKYVRMDVLKERGLKVSLSSFDFHRLTLEDQIFLVKFFASTEEAWVEIECRRILGIYVRNMYAYDFQLSIEGRREKCNLTCSNNTPGDGVHIKGFINEGMESEGFAYLQNGSLELFRLKEMVKYSDATLSWLLMEMEGTSTERTALKEKCLKAINRRIKLREQIRKGEDWLLSEVNPKKMLHNDFAFPTEYEVDDVYFVEVEEDVHEVSQDTDQSQNTEAAEEQMAIDVNGYFLEFSLPHFFQPRVISFQDVYHDKPEFSRYFRRELTKLAKPKDSVYSEFLITRIREIKIKKFMKNDYFSFEVLREDGKVYYFTEADFENLNVADFHKLNNLLINKESSKYKEERGALSVIRSAMYYILRWYSYIDFQIALYIPRTSVYISKPNNDHPELKNRKSGTVTVSPELGLFMRNDKEEKIFFRAKEVAKYCSGTLRFIKHNLEKRLSKGVQVEEMQKIIDAIDKRLALRNILVLKIVPALKELEDSKFATI